MCKWMRRVFRSCLLVLPIAVVGCQKSSPGASNAGRDAGTLARRLAQTDGTIRVPGLKNDVKVVRDRSGIPHIYAKNSDPAE